jgi:hypothetical protein
MQRQMFRTYSPCAVMSEGDSLLSVPMGVPMLHRVVYSAPAPATRLSPSQGWLEVDANPLRARHIPPSLAIRTCSQLS